MHLIITSKKNHRFQVMIRTPNSINDKTILIRWFVKPIRYGNILIAIVMYHLGAKKRIRGTVFRTKEDFRNFIE